MSDAPENLWVDTFSEANRGPNWHNKPVWSATEYRRADLPPTREQIMADPRVMALVGAAREAMLWDNHPDLWHDDLKSALAALTDNEGEIE